MPQGKLPRESFSKQQKIMFSPKYSNTEENVEYCKRLAVHGGRGTVLGRQCSGDKVPGWHNDNADNNKDDADMIPQGPVHSRNPC